MKRIKELNVEFPSIGMRIIKSAIAVLLCFVVDYFRSGAGEVFMAAFDRVCSGIPQMDKLEEFDANYENLKDIIRIYDINDMGFMLCNDMKKERIICFKK